MLVSIVQHTVARAETVLARAGISYDPVIPHKTVQLRLDPAWGALMLLAP